MLHSSFSMTPFKVTLCSLVYLAVEKPEIYPREISRVVIEYVLDQFKLSQKTEQESDMVEKSIRQIKADLKERIVDLFKNNRTTIFNA